MVESGGGGTERPEWKGVAGRGKAGRVEQWQDRLVVESNGRRKGMERQAKD